MSASNSRFTVSRDTAFLALATTPSSRLDRAYDAIARRKAKMSPGQVLEFNDKCLRMREDYNRLLSSCDEIIKDIFTNPKYGLVSKMRRQRRLWSPSNPDGITELYTRWAPRKDLMDEFGFLVYKDGEKPKYQKPKEFTFHFNSLADGGVWKTNRHGEEFFDNMLFLAAYKDERISVPEGVSALAVLAKRTLAPSFIKVTDVSDKSKSDKEFWEVRFFYKDAYLAQHSAPRSTGGAGAGAGASTAEVAVSDEEETYSDNEDAVSDEE